MTQTSRKITSFNWQHPERPAYLAEAVYATHPCPIYLPNGEDRFATVRITVTAFDGRYRVYDVNERETASTYDTPEAAKDAAERYIRAAGEGYHARR